MNVLVICQGPAYGDERSYNGHRATLDDLADWVLWADKTVTF